MRRRGRPASRGSRPLLELVEDHALRQRGLEFLHPGVGDISFAEIQPFQLGQPLQVHQPGVGDLSAIADCLNGSRILKSLCENAATKKKRGRGTTAR